MVAGNWEMIGHNSERFNYDDACRMANIAHETKANCIVINLDRTNWTTTAALARLVLLRRKLLFQGRDLRIVGLHNRANGLYEVTRMTNLLPREQLAVATI